jgi:2-polyprenyl-6-methoxyphenol hydroxylase-like FAD-dependent oxidoreductase
MGAGITIFPNSMKALEMLGIDTKQVQATRITKVRPMEVSSGTG